MNIFITGATGFVGRAVVARLQRHHALTAWVRDEARARSLLGANIALVRVTPDRSELGRALLKTHAVINLAGEPLAPRRFTAERKRMLRDSRIDLTRGLVDAMAEQSFPPRVLISASAVGYYGERVDSAVAEDAPAGSGFLATLCADWEAAALEARTLGVRVVTLRTGIVLGQGGGALARLLPLFRARLGARLGDGHQSMSWIHLRDLVEVIATALESQSLSGPVNAVSPRPVTNSEFTRELACAVGKPAVFTVPAFALRLAYGEAASLLLGGQRCVPAKLLAAGFQFQFPELAPALQDLAGADSSCEIARARDLPHAAYLRERGASHELTCETVIDAPLADVFEFFSQAANLGQLTPPDLEFTMLTPTPVEMKPGALLEYRIKLGPIPVRWQTRIDSWEPSARFVDVQARGPYRSWWHEHTFRQRGSQTVMRDRVLYALPLGPLGRLIHRWKVAGILRRIFDYRARAIDLRFGLQRPSRPAADVIPLHASSAETSQ